ncbi:MAG: metallophosphoesterase family protein [Thermoplasmatota archaeon]
MRCIFVSDLHGKKDRYEKLVEVIRDEKPDAVFIGGDILPGFIRSKKKLEKFLDEYLFTPLSEIREASDRDIRCFIIMGNDDPRKFEQILFEADEKGMVDYINQRCVNYDDIDICGYSFVPPTPFQLKDWEKYDVSRFTDVGAVSPESGTRTVDVPENKIRHSTIKDDLDELAHLTGSDKTIYLFHAPPYETNLDRADLDGKKVQHVEMDVHVGSIAIKRFIEEKQPLLTLHGHVHETVELTGKWKDMIGETLSITGVSSGEELALIRFDTDDIMEASRELI